MVEVYGGTGAIREIGPISISGNKVRARCYTSDAVKTFVLDKIELAGNNADDGNQTPVWTPGGSSEEFNSLADAVNHFHDDLVGMGWVVELADNSVGLFRRYKNGKLLKHPDVSLSFVEKTTDIVWDLETNEATSVEKVRQRPWTVHCRFADTSPTFRILDRAAERFMNFARDNAPK